MHCAAPGGTGEVIVTTEQPPDCSAYVLLSAGDYDSLRNPFGAEPDFSIVGWAFGAGLFLWAAGIGLGLILQIIYRAKR